MTKQEVEGEMIMERKHKMVLFNKVIWKVQLLC